MVQLDIGRSCMTVVAAAPAAVPLSPQQRLLFVQPPLLHPSCCIALLCKECECTRSRRVKRSIKCRQSEHALVRRSVEKEKQMSGGCRRGRRRAKSSCLACTSQQRQGEGESRRSSARRSGTPRFGLRREIDVGGRASPSKLCACRAVGRILESLRLGKIMNLCRSVSRRLRMAVFFAPKSEAQYINALTRLIMLLPPVGDNMSYACARATLRSAQSLTHS